MCRCSSVVLTPPFSGHPGCGGLLQRLSVRTCRCHRDVLLLQPWGGRGCGEWWASMNGGWRVSMCLNPSVASPLAVDLGARGRSRRSPRLRRAQPLPRPRPRAPARREGPTVASTRRVDAARCAGAKEGHSVPIHPIHLSHAHRRIFLFFTSCSNLNPRCLPAALRLILREAVPLATLQA